MTDKFVIDETIGEDGIVRLPPDAPRGNVRITIEPAEETESVADKQLSPEEEAALDAEIAALLTPEALKGEGLTAEEIARSPEIGAWAHRTDITNSVEFINKMREENRRRRQRRD